MINLLLSGNLQAQVGSKQTVSTVIKPMEIPIFLSGNFGEPRANHFHSGIDIKTGGVPGVPVRSVAPGYVSRIKVEPGGYGQALYLNHPNGYTSVYAHLQSFNKNIAEFVKHEQYRRESFSVDLFPESSRFPVEAGQVIASS
ncbi:MAG: M23 family metallopeptidase, partial [Bacteroidales bacterium]|nr:M23 family metallopeptidase [Bacteroidales bacterium]